MYMYLYYMVLSSFSQKSSCWLDCVPQLEIRSCNVASFTYQLLSHLHFLIYVKKAIVLNTLVTITMVSDVHVD